MNKIQEKISQAAYGSIIGGLAVLGLAFVVRKKVLDKIKKIW